MGLKAFRVGVKTGDHGMPIDWEADRVGYAKAERERRCNEWEEDW